jgi:hypothetical protein
MRLILPLTLLLALAVGCTEPGEVCTTDFVYSFSVQVLDSVTHAPVASDATLIWSQGTLRDSVIAGSGPQADSVALVGPGERAGTFDLVVRKAGYQLWHRRIDVERDRCHVHRVAVMALLQRL